MLRDVDPVVGFKNGDKWYQTGLIGSASFDCGYCGTRTSSDQGYHCGGASPQTAFIRLCSGCLAPTFFLNNGDQHPGAMPGESVSGLPSELEKLFREVRLAARAGAHTAAVMSCRTILMHVAVQEGADENQSFKFYVDFLNSHGYIPPKGKAWVNYIKDRGNEANHEIVLKTPEESKAVITFAGMLLKFVYELPAAVPK